MQHPRNRFSPLLRRLFMHLYYLLLNFARKGKFAKQRSFVSAKSVYWGNLAGWRLLSQDWKDHQLWLYRTSQTTRCLQASKASWPPGLQGLQVSKTSSPPRTPGLKSSSPPRPPGLQASRHQGPQASQQKYIFLETHILCTYYNINLILYPRRHTLTCLIWVLIIFIWYLKSCRDHEIMRIKSLVLLKSLPKRSSPKYILLVMKRQTFCHVKMWKSRITRHKVPTFSLS